MKNKFIFNVINLRIKEFFIFISSESIIFSCLLLVGLIIGLVILFLFEPKIHENSHAIAMKKMRKNTKEFKESLTKDIKYNKFKSAYITSNYLDFLATDPYKYSKEIKIIAKGGIKYSSYLYLILLMFSLYLTLFFSHYYVIFIVIFIFLLIIIWLTYLLGYKEKYKNGKLISQPDRFLVKHPEQFKNIHK